MSEKTVSWSVPVGTVISFFGDSAPDGYLPCDGKAYDKSAYPELSSHLLSLYNSTFFVVDGDETKFKVPDLRGEFLRGTGTNSHENQGNGQSVGTHQDATEHNVINLSSSIKRVQMKNATDWSSNYSKPDSWFIPSSTNVTRVDGSTAATTSVSNELDRFTSRPTNTSVLYCIKAN